MVNYLVSFADANQSLIGLLSLGASLFISPIRFIIKKIIIKKRKIQFFLPGALVIIWSALWLGVILFQDGPPSRFDTFIIATNSFNIILCLFLCMVEISRLNDLNKARSEYDLFSIKIE